MVYGPIESRTTNKMKKILQLEGAKRVNLVQNFEICLLDIQRLLATSAASGNTHDTVMVFIVGTLGGSYGERLGITR